jgi:hypothetical protein
VQVSYPADPSDVTHHRALSVCTACILLRPARGNELSTALWPTLRAVICATEVSTTTRIRDQANGDDDEKLGARHIHLHIDPKALVEALL